MDIVAIIACRNDEAYLANCLRHLLDNGILFAVLDHESSDGTADLLRRPDLRRGLVALEKLPFDGSFALETQLEAKTQMMEHLRADWIIHLDIDEIMHSSRDGESLHDAITRLAAGGANAINFDEFVFLPVDHDYVPDALGPQPMRHYYFFEPNPRRLMRAWEKQAGLRWGGSGGHQLTGTKLTLATESLTLRHYIFRSQAHAFSKYAERHFAEHETHRFGWHSNRINQPAERFLFPPVSMLEVLPFAGARAISKRNPMMKHYWQWEPIADREDALRRRWDLSRLLPGVRR